MSKLALIRQYQYSPAAGGGILSGVLKFGKKLLGIGKKVAPQVLPKGKQLLNMAAPAVVAGMTYAGADALLGGSGSGGGSGASGFYGGRRRARGITARELRGYRKVANLLHKEGMVSRRARGRK